MLQRRKSTPLALSHLLLAGIALIPATALVTQGHADEQPPAKAQTEAPQNDSTGSDQAADETADQKRPEGHSIHGEVFNDGPRQAAVLMDDVGAGDFQVTTDNEDARRFVQQGIGQIHGYWYFEAERSFRQAAQLDENCAIAYWGMAVANRGNKKRATDFIENAVKRKDSASRREQLLIEAFDRYIKAKSENENERKSRSERYVSDMESILLEFPDDLETKALLCEYLWSGRRDGLPSQSALAVNALIQEILNVDPLHPVHHFRIHLWDGKKPELALESAARGGLAAPGIAHMWHMPGHIYSRVRRYHDAVWQQEASARVDHAHMMNYQILPDQIHNFAHNNEWCIRNLISIGRADDAEALAINMISLPRHPRYNQINGSGSFRYGHQRLIDVLTAFERWERIAELSDSSILQNIGREEEELSRDRAIGAAFAMLGRTEDANEIRARLAAQHAEKTAEQEKAAADAEKAATEKKEDEKAIKAARTAAERKFSAAIRNLDQAIQEIDGRLALQRQEYETAADLLNKAGVTAEQLAPVQLLAGKTDDALKQIEQRVSAKANEVLPLAVQAKLLFDADRKDQAKASFEKLRDISSTIDLDCRPFQALATAAAEFGFGQDWRQQRTLPEDLGPRPDLDALGPFRWAPVQATDWTLPDLDQKQRTLAEFRGRPVIMVFYLGYGCLHCAEQLHEIQKRYADFAAAGLEIVAISTDAQQDLQRAALDLESGFSFPLTADPEMNVFRQYRCFDDFESTPLHGTFLIDPEGAIRWHDISYEPFRNMDFLLEESRRLISIPQVDYSDSPLTITQQTNH